MLCDKEIRILCIEGMVKPFTPELLGSASLDVRVGKSLLEETPDPERRWDTVDIRLTDVYRPYLIKPDHFVLVGTLEIFYLPDDVSAQFCLKSSRAREGLEHSLAGFCDPGWNGSVLTMELRNNSRFYDIPIYYGMAIGQMVFFRLAMKPESSYRDKGHYNRDRDVQGSRFEPNLFKPHLSIGFETE